MTDLQALLKALRFIYTGRTGASVAKRQLTIKRTARPCPALCPGSPLPQHLSRRTSDPSPLETLIKILHKGKVLSPFCRDWKLTKYDNDTEFPCGLINSKLQAAWIPLRLLALFRVKKVSSWWSLVKSFIAMLDRNNDRPRPLAHEALLIYSI